MQSALKSNELRRTCVHKSSKMEIQKEVLNNSDFLQNFFAPEIWSALFIMHKSWKSNEWRTNCVLKTSKIDLQKAGPNNAEFLQNWFLPEIISPLLSVAESSKLWELC